LRDLKEVIRSQLSDSRDLIGLNLAAFRAIGRKDAENKSKKFGESNAAVADVWEGMGLGSDIAAALQKKKKSKK
jgi:hypothetical protein